MLMYIMLYIMIASLMLFAAIFNAVCLHNAFFFFIMIFFVFCLGLLTQSIYFKKYFSSCTVLLICWFFKI